MPTKAHDSDAGFDLYTREDVVVFGESDAIIDTGVHMSIPNGYVGFVKAKSGLSVKHQIEHGAGVVDAGYTGSICVHLYNHNGTRYKFKSGEKVAQIVILPIPCVELNLVNTLEDSERGSNGFGSSGK